jgi:ADP-ribose pyrophosphatase
MSKINTRFTKADVTILKKESFYKGFFELNRYHFTHKLFAGGESKLIMREVFERGHAVAVLPYDPIRDELVLLEQFRFPAMETNDNPWLIEVIAGIIEPGEDLDDVCHREADEEAGIKLANLTKISSYLASPGACTERIHVYLAKVDASTAKGIHGLDSEAEDIKVLRVPLDQAKQWLSEGIIDNSTAIIALQWLLLNKQKVLDDWDFSKD